MKPLSSLLFLLRLSWFQLPQLLNRVFSPVVTTSQLSSQHFLSDTRLTTNKELTVHGGMAGLKARIMNERNVCLGMNYWALALCLVRIDDN
jgi:hypothetical protein